MMIIVILEMDIMRSFQNFGLEMIQLVGYNIKYDLQWVDFMLNKSVLYKYWSVIVWICFVDLRECGFNILKGQFYFNRIMESILFYGKIQILGKGNNWIEYFIVDRMGRNILRV